MTRRDAGQSADAPRIAFPCDYPVKVMGANEDDFVAIVVGLGRRHAPELTDADVSVRTSRNERWVSVTMTIQATGEAQLKALFEDLKATGRIQLVL